MDDASPHPPLLERSLASGRVHSAYLISGPGEAPRRAALHFVRGLVCQAASDRPCEACDACRRSQPGEAIEIDGTGKRGPLYRHVGDHADLLWTERGPDDTRVRIGQIRALQHALRLRSGEGGRRAAVIADAEWLNQESQNALLRLLEEPPPETSVVLVTASSAGLLATVRSRCQRVALRGEEQGALDDPEQAETLARLESIAAASLPDLLDWAEQFRGQRAAAAAGVEALLASGAAFLRQRIHQRAHDPGPALRSLLDAHRDLSSCRKVLVQRNANPQMVAERALLALQAALAA
jgi:DNA polymerase III delta prime subunit